VEPTPYGPPSGRGHHGRRPLGETLGRHAPRLGRPPPPNGLSSGGLVGVSLFTLFIYY
jgi:hypothetical protein